MRFLLDINIVSDLVRHPRGTFRNPNAEKRSEKIGTPIGGNDMFIAAHALALGCTLVTDNVREFSRIKTLTVENRLR